MTRCDEELYGIRGPQLCALVGITYRQLDYWANTGLLVPSVADARGSGSKRLYSTTDVAVARVIANLLQVDLSSKNRLATNSRLTLARGVAPIVRSLIESGAEDLILVITADDVIPVTTGDELLAAVRQHAAVTVLSGFGLVPPCPHRDAAPGPSGADVVTTSSGVSTAAAPVG